MLKFGQKEVKTKGFYEQRQITDICMIDVNNLVVSDRVPCNNGKDHRYIVGYQVYGGLVPLCIKTPKNKFIYGVSQYNKNSASAMLFNVSEKKEWVSQYKNIWNEVVSQNGNRTIKKRRKVRLWQVENVERTNKDKFSWSRCSI